MKKRHLKNLSADEQVDIIHSYLMEHLKMNDIASRHHISARLVGRLVSKYKTDRDMINDKRI